MLKHKIYLLRLEEKPVENCRIVTRSFNHEEDYNIETNITAEFHKGKDGHLKFGYSKEVTMLKFCLGKSESVRKSLQLKVSLFFLPAKDDEHRKKSLQAIMMYAKDLT